MIFFYIFNDFNLWNVFFDILKVKFDNCFFLFYNINLKRYFIEGFDIFIIKNMCNGVFV